MPSTEAALFEGKVCRIVPKTPIHYENIMQVTGMPVVTRILKWLDHGILIEGNMFVPWSNIISIESLEETLEEHTPLR